MILSSTSWLLSPPPGLLYVVSAAFSSAGNLVVVGWHGWRAGLVKLNRASSANELAR